MSQVIEVTMIIVPSQNPGMARKKIEKVLAPKSNHESGLTALMMPMRSPTSRATTIPSIQE